MTDLVSPDEAERVVGVARHDTDHYARAVSAAQTVYILHSKACKEATPDLRDCEFSVALDRGIDSFIPWSGWSYVQDRPVRVGVFRGFLVPELKAVKAARRG